MTKIIRKSRAEKEAERLHWEAVCLRDQQLREKLHGEALAAMKAHPFFGPFVETYGEDVAVPMSSIRTHSDYSTDNLLYVKLDLLYGHFYNLELPDAGYKKREQYTKTTRTRRRWQRERYERHCKVHAIAIELDKDRAAFVTRVGMYFCGGSPTIQEMLRASLSADPTRYPFGPPIELSKELIKAILWWSEEKHRWATQAAAA